MIERRIINNRKRAGYSGIKSTSSIGKTQLGIRARSFQGQDLVADRYRLESVIGRGGMGYIYRALDTVTNEIVALKKLKPELVHKDTQIVTRFEREGRLQESLHHPHIVEVTATINHEDGHFLVMEYIDGGTLEDRLVPNQPMGLEEALAISVPIAEALVHAHEKNIIHRDLKPANILLQKDGTPKLTDFGTAFIEDQTRLTQAGTIIGTYAYMSPEVCNGSELDERTDIWSFGVLLYEMVTGQLPYYHENPMHLMLAIMREPPDDIQLLNPEVPDHLAELIYRMLTKDKHLRIPKMSLVQSELNHISKFGLKTTGVPTNVKVLGYIPQRLYRFPMVPPLVGREMEIEQITNLFFDSGSRLISIVGPGGSGKTHLAIHIGDSLQKSFPDGAYFSDLGGIDEHILIISAIANGLNFNFFGQDEAEVQLYNYLSNKDLILVLDNVEHTSVVNPIINEIMTQAPGVKIIVTTREPLYLRDEWQLPLTGLSVSANSLESPAQCDACHLFIQAARRSHTDYEPDESERLFIAAICRLVGGLPLAIELAAGWIGTLTAEEILEELRGDLSILESDTRDIPSRHRSIRAVYEHAWNQLNQDEQVALQSMSIFAGGFERTAVRKVVGANLMTLNSLVNKSLLKRSPDDGLYRVQELVRRFAAEKLSSYPNDKVELREKHTQFYLKDMPSKAVLMRGGDQINTLSKIDLAHENIRLAIQWSLAEAHLDLIDGWLEAMFHYYVLRGRQTEGYESYADVSRQLPLVINSNSHILIAKALARQGALGVFVDYGEQSKKLLLEALNLVEHFNDNAELAFILTRLCGVDRSNPNLHSWSQRAYEIGQDSGRIDLMADALNWLAFKAYIDGHFDEALELLDDTLSLRRSLNDNYGMAGVLNNRGVVLNDFGDLEKARDLFEEARGLAHILNNQILEAQIFLNLARNSIFNHSFNDALVYNERGLNQFYKVGDKINVITALYNSIEIYIKQNRLDEALELCDQGVSLCKETNFSQKRFLVYYCQIHYLQRNLNKSIDFLIEIFGSEEGIHLKFEVILFFSEQFLLLNERDASIYLGLFVLNNSESLMFRQRSKVILNKLNFSPPSNLTSISFQEILLRICNYLNEFGSR